MLQALRVWLGELRLGWLAWLLAALVVLLPWLVMGNNWARRVWLVVLAWFAVVGCVVGVRDHNRVDITLGVVAAVVVTGFMESGVRSIYTPTARNFGVARMLAGAVLIVGRAATFYWDEATTWATVVFAVWLIGSGLREEWAAQSSTGGPRG